MDSKFEASGFQSSSERTPYIRIIGNRKFEWGILLFCNALFAAFISTLDSHIFQRDFSIFSLFGYVRGEQPEHSDYKKHQKIWLYYIYFFLMTGFRVLKVVIILYNVVIIDDEPIIVQGLISIVPWEQYGCVIAGQAFDGIEGERIIREVVPDIIFTDIRMPLVDGLAMIAGIRSEFPKMQITVLTGYRDFTYAQTAITLGVTRYLLKPSKIDEITEALQEMTKRLGGVPEVSESGQHAGNFIVRNAVNYVNEHYNEKLTLAEVAREVYVSQWHLSKLLNKHMNQNFFEIINNIRVREAAKLLADPSLRISEIAEKVGFIDVAHFSRVFKKIQGVSANEYRNQRN